MLTTTLPVSIIRPAASAHDCTASTKSPGSTEDKKQNFDLLRGKILESSADNRCRSDGDEYREFLGGSPVNRCFLIIKSESPLMCNSNFEKKLPPTVSHHSKRQFKHTGSRMGILSLLPLLWAVFFVVDVTRVDAGFPHRRVDGKSRIEGPVVPAPKNWGYRPTRWIRWETDIIHPSLGPIAPDAKKEIKTPDADETGAAETTASGAAPSNSEESSPSTEPGSEMLPPLPSDDGPPATPSNIDEDLPPLPGDNFNAPLSNPAPVTEKQSPESRASDPPSFRDPDAIFDKSERSQTPQGAPRVLPPLPGIDSPKVDKADPTTVPQPTAPEPIPTQPLPTTPPNQPPIPTELPEEQQPKWEKRTRKKPVDPQDIQKQTPKQKPDEPFYDPDSIFDERATRNQGPAKVRWQKAGTVSQPASSIEKYTTNQKAIPRQRQDHIFSQVKPVKITTINRASIPSIEGSQPESTATAIAASALFEAERPRRIRSQQPTWKAAKKANQPATNPPPIRQDHLVRPATFEQPIEQPIGQTPAKDPPLRPTTPTVNDNVSAPRKAIRPDRSQSNAVSTKASSTTAATINAARKTTVVGKKASVGHKTLASQSETGLPVVPTESLRNPMRKPVREQEQLSEDNPLREKNQPVAESPTTIVSKLSNPLR